MSLQFTGIFYLHWHSYSSLAKTWPSIQNRISPGLKVFHITHYLCSECSFVFFLNQLTANERHWKEPWFRRPFLKSRQMRWYTYIHTYLHPKISNEAGLEHRQSRLVTYATWISLLWSHQALQQISRNIRPEDFKQAPLSFLWKSSLLVHSCVLR